MSESTTFSHWPPRSLQGTLVFSGTSITLPQITRPLRKRRYCSGTRNSHTPVAPRRREKYSTVPPAMGTAGTLALRVPPRVQRDELRLLVGIPTTAESFHFDVSSSTRRITVVGADDICGRINGGKHERGLIRSRLVLFLKEERRARHARLAYNPFNGGRARPTRGQ